MWIALPGELEMVSFLCLWFCRRCWMNVWSTPTLVLFSLPSISSLDWPRTYQTFTLISMREFEVCIMLKWYSSWLVPLGTFIVLIIAGSHWTQQVKPHLQGSGSPTPYYCIDHCCCVDVQQDGALQLGLKRLWLKRLSLLPCRVPLKLTVG